MYYRQFTTVMNSALYDLLKAISSCSHCYKEHKKEYWVGKVKNTLDTIIKHKLTFPEHYEKYQLSLPTPSSDAAIDSLKLLEKALRMVEDKKHIDYLSAEIGKLIYIYPALVNQDADGKVLAKPESVTAPDVLEAGAKHMRDRAVTYDKPEGERSMEKVVQMFNLFTGHNLKESEGWRFMLFLKLVRSVQGEFKLDNFEDAVAYEALAAEAAAKGK